MRRAPAESSVVSRVIPIAAIALVLGGTVAVGLFVAFRDQPPPPVQPMPLATFKATMPEGKHVFTLDCRLSDDFHSPRTFPPANWYSLELTDPVSGGTLRGYASKHTPAGEAILARLKDAGVHRLRVRLYYPGEFHGSGVVVVDGIEPHTASRK